MSLPTLSPLCMWYVSPRPLSTISVACFSPPYVWLVSPLTVWHATPHPLRGMQLRTLCVACHSTPRCGMSLQTFYSPPSVWHVTQHHVSPHPLCGMSLPTFWVAWCVWHVSPHPQCGMSIHTLSVACVSTPSVRHATPHPLCGVFISSQVPCEGPASVASPGPRRVRGERRG